jgi:hypothetical protein
MTKNVTMVDRDEVLLAFHKSCERPSAQDIIEWTAKYPAFADDIRDHAAILRDWAAREGLPEQVPDELALARGRSRALNALHAARKMQAEEPMPVASFEAMMAEKGTNIRELARQLDIDRGVLADMVSGRMRPPVGERLVAAWMKWLGVTRDLFERAFAAARATPKLGHAKADGPPQIIPRTYEDIIRSSHSMSDERIRYWLEEDQPWTHGEI